MDNGALVDELEAGLFVERTELFVRDEEHAVVLARLCESAQVLLHEVEADVLLAVLLGDADGVYAYGLGAGDVL